MTVVITPNLLLRARIKAIAYVMCVKYVCYIALLVELIRYSGDTSFGHHDLAFQLGLIGLVALLAQMGHDGIRLNSWGLLFPPFCMTFVAVMALLMTSGWNLALAVYSFLNLIDSSNREGSKHEWALALSMNLCMCIGTIFIVFLIIPPLLSLIMIHNRIREMDKENKVRSSAPLLVA